MDISDENAMRIAEAIEKLAKEAASLRRATLSLAKQICPDAKLDTEEWKSGPNVRLPVKDMKDLMNRLRIHRDGLEGAQSDIGRIRAMHVEIRENMRSRTEWEPFSTSGPPGRRKGDA